jgi:hypothetical protein
MKKAFNRDEGNSSYGLNLLISCQFKMVEQKGKSKKKCSSPPRIKEFENIGFKVNKEGVDRKSLSLIKRPASEKGLGFMQIDYIKAGKSSDQWMYLPALKKTKRIVADEGGPKTGSFFGSEISYEDIEKHHEDDFTYKLLKEEKIKNRETWVIEMIPTLEKAKTRTYGKSINWISKENYLILKSEHYDKRGFLIKTYKQNKIEKQKGIWVVKQMVVISHQKKRMSMLKLKSVVINAPIPEDLIGLRALKDETFLEEGLNKIRSGK